jgi:cyclophilin family peptidyl-prolyl cis-trans isomerase
MSSKWLVVPLMALAFAGSSYAAKQNPHPRVLLKTSEGDIVLELDHDKAPITVDNFLGYVKRGFYDGTIFHRSIKGFMIQGGGYTTDYEKKPTEAPIKNEADNGLKNVRGAIAMARTSDPNSATAQFFINTVDNLHLDFASPTDTGWGYAVFGKVVEGMDVVDRIQDIDTGPGGPFARDVPRKMVVIEKATRLRDSDSK